MNRIWQLLETKKEGWPTTTVYSEGTYSQLVALLYRGSGSGNYYEYIDVYFLIC